MANLPFSRPLPPTDLPPDVDPAQRQVQAHPEFKDWNSAYNLLGNMQGRNALVLLEIAGKKGFEYGLPTTLNPPQIFLDAPIGLPLGQNYNFGEILRTGDFLRCKNYGINGSNGFAIAETPAGNFTLTSSQANVFLQDFVQEKTPVLFEPSFFRAKYLWLPNVQVIAPSQGAKAPPPPPPPQSNCAVVCKDHGGGCVFDSGSTMYDSYLKPGQKAYQIVCKNGFVFESFGDKDATGRLVFAYAGNLSGLGSEQTQAKGSSRPPPSGSASGSMSSFLPNAGSPKLGPLGKFRFRYEAVQSGDTLGTFCSRNGLTRQQFFELNPTKPRLSLGDNEYTTLLQEREECLVEVVF